MKKDLVYIILICIAFLFGFFKCSNTRTKYEVKTKTETQVTYKTSTRIVPFPLPIPKKITIRVLKPFYDTIRKSDMYTNLYKDSLIEGKIITEIKDCKMINQSLIYKPLFPKYIIRTDSVFKTTTITNDRIKNYWSLYGGFNIIAPKNLSIYPTLGLKTRQDRFVEIGYDFINKNAMIGLKLNIWKK